MIPRARTLAAAASRQRGATMIEVLITLLIVTFGLLALAGFVVKASASGVDASQRARALSLLEDMSQRMQNNKALIASYVTTTTYGAAAMDCSGQTGAALDLCSWNNLLVGTNDQVGTTTSPVRFRGCVTQPYTGAPVYAVTVAWGTQIAGTPPADTCGQNAFGDDSYRRIVRTQVRAACLSC